MAWTRLSRMRCFCAAVQRFAGDRLAGEIDDGAGAVDLGGPGPGSPSGVHGTRRERAGSSVAGARSARENDDLVAVAGEGGA